jgi:segregation and condensation protein B
VVETGRAFVVGDRQPPRPQKNINGEANRQRNKNGSFCFLLHDAQRYQLFFQNDAKKSNLSYFCAMKQHIEALIFASPQPVRLDDIVATLTESLQMPVESADVQAQIEAIRTQFQAEDFAFELVELAGGYQFLTKGAYHHTITVHLKQSTKKRLSQAALETLALIAYKQPVSKSELEEIRGVNCDYAITKLLERELVAITGRSEGPGRPLLYGTTDKFMDYFGINSLIDLPKLKDFKEVENMVGEAQE